MTLWDLRDFQSYWAEHPPLHVMVAAYLGIGRSRPTKTSPAELLAQFGSKRS